MYKYKVPSDIIGSFHSVASENYSKNDGKHIETLAFLAGFREENVFTVTDIVFPKQNGGPMHVDDQGKLILIIYLSSISASLGNGTLLVQDNSKPSTGLYSRFPLSNDRIS